MTFPRSISVVPFRREEIETARSGAPVPKAIMVRPIRSLLTLKWEAVDEAPSISQSAPLIRRTKPTISKVICRRISISKEGIYHEHNRRNRRRRKHHENSGL